LITLLFVITVLYLAVTKKQIEPEALGYTPSIITVEELPDKGNE
tara:strand:+ start:636 stop:767 length:132 start_codon:yes stop_codon:yes gene_type:complete